MRPRTGERAAMEYLAERYRERTRRAERIEDIAFALACAAVCSVALLQVLS